MLEFHQAPQIVYMVWKMTNPNRCSTGQHLGRCQVRARQVSAITRGTESDGQECDLVLTSAPASKAELCIPHPHESHGAMVRL